jgi:hypothetical protein
MTKKEKLTRLEAVMNDVHAILDAVATDDADDRTTKHIPNISNDIYKVWGDVQKIHKSIASIITSRELK